LKIVLWPFFLWGYLALVGGQVSFAFEYGEVGPPGADSVHIGKTAIVMPLRKILLVRKGDECCGIRFTKFWTGRTAEDFYAEYESYRLAKQEMDVVWTKGGTQRLSFPKPRGIGRLAFSFGNKEVECGSIKLFWSGNGAVHFYGKGQEQGNYGVELAPTKWEDCSVVNPIDPRLTWYKYDPERERKNVPVEGLW
jgi:hypothetical protein